MEVVNQSAPPLESEVNGRSAPPMPEQAPTLNNGVLDVAFNTNQGNNPTVNTYSISNITVNTADHETTLLGPERSVPNTSFSSTQPILNNGVLNLASSVHQEDGMRTVTPEGSPTVRPIPPATADPAIGPAYHGNEADPNDEIIVDPLLQQLIDDYYTGGNEDQNAIL
ncbi:uncharacterized protein F4822DRAFT_188709 [Hypoxylon trugodes]|uniref:uncharacterized protein n=1 Tax=Hypoxylon trugodes TaxID=326681 RepID=UPI002192D5C9|nr:uncharacterized protein F4822DRAFT_188709 [Hypoxylon trugodes]KAI1391538.1 hypothetical protein F4822DRAFT_188709 [Hypoxylon trugodes]